MGYTGTYITVTAAEYLMKFVGVSAPAWTIPGRHPEKEQMPSDEEEPRIVDSDALSKKHLYPRVKDIIFHGPVERRIRKSEDKEEDEQVKTERVIEKTPTKKKAKKAGWNTRPERFPTKIYTGPGPDTYQQDLTKSITTHMPNFSMGYRYDPPKPDQLTKSEVDSSSTALESQSSLPKIHKPKPKRKHDGFGSSPRFHSKGQDLCAPGPGKYTVVELRGNVSSTKGTFGNPNHKRPDINGKPPESNDQVNMDEIIDQSTIEYRMSKITPLKIRSESEARIKKPEPPVVISKTKSEFVPSGPKWTFADANAKIRQRFKVDVPADADRSLPEDEGQQSRLPKIRSIPNFPRAERNPISSTHNFPGPGQYYADPKEDDELGKKIYNIHNGPGGPKYTIRGKYELPENRDKLRMPGPQYFYDHCYGVGWGLGRSHKFGTSVRPGDEVVDPESKFKTISQTEYDMPGPGTYDTRGDIGTQGISFARSKRKPMANNADADIEVGPGQYTLKPTVPQLQPFEQARLYEQENPGYDLI